MRDGDGASSKAYRVKVILSSLPSPVHYTDHSELCVMFRSQRTTVTRAYRYLSNRFCSQTPALNRKLLPRLDNASRPTHIRGLP